jgi:hypothetical protein
MSRIKGNGVGGFADMAHTAIGPRRDNGDREGAPALPEDYDGGDGFGDGINYATPLIAQYDAADNLPALLACMALITE